MENGVALYEDDDVLFHDIRPIKEDDKLCGGEMSDIGTRRQSHIFLPLERSMMLMCCVSI